MSLTASATPVDCCDQERPPSSVRLTKPSSPAIQPRLASTKKTAFKSFPACPRRALGRIRRFHSHLINSNRKSRIKSKDERTRLERLALNDPILFESSRR